MPIMLDDDSINDEIEDSESEGGAWLARPAQRKSSSGGLAAAQQEQHGLPDQAPKVKMKTPPPNGQIASFFSKLPLGECAV